MTRNLDTGLVRTFVTVAERASMTAVVGCTAACSSTAKALSR